MKIIFTLIISLICSSILVSQSVVIEGYTFETGNRGFIAGAKVVIMSGEEVLKTTIADKEGHFYSTVPSKDIYTLKLTSDLYEDLSMEVRGDTKSDDNKIFVKAQMKRLPGYLLELTMAEERSNEDSIVNAISNTRIDIFNNSTFEEVQVLDDYPEPQFSVPLFKENHYTILIRKEGYIAKRIEAFVDVEGCILCFEGLGSVTPGVTENLSRNNQIGVLLANVSLEKAFSGKTIVLKDLYYDLGSAKLKWGAKKELNKLVGMMKDNPGIKVELGAHTDARGNDDTNLSLSQRRAQNAVLYLIEKGIDEERIISHGYGETQLRNECADGVKCTEKMHAFNRRTEIKILDVVKSDEPVKSLKQMKMMARAEKEMEELAFGGQVKIDNPKDTNSEEEAEENTIKDNQEKTKEIIEKVKEKSTSDVMEASDELAPEVNKDMDMIDESAKPVLTKVIDPEELEKSKEIIYKVLIKETVNPLSKEHALYKTHSDLLQVKTYNGYKYLIGSFTNLAEVMKFHKDTATIVYPKATIVKYSDGEIIE